MVHLFKIDLLCLFAYFCIYHIFIPGIELQVGGASYVIMCLSQAVSATLALRTPFFGFQIDCHS